MSEPTARRGYHRTRPADLAPWSFVLNGHLFETGQRDLWVTLAGEDRVDRIKVTRGSSSRSAQTGYPSELVWDWRLPAPAHEDIEAAALFWLQWRESADAAGHPTVGLGHYERQLELRAAKELLAAGV